MGWLPPEDREMLEVCDVQNRFWHCCFMPHQLIHDYPPLCVHDFLSLLAQDSLDAGMEEHLSEEDFKDESTTDFHQREYDESQPARRAEYDADEDYDQPDYTGPQPPRRTDQPDNAHPQLRRNSSRRHVRRSLKVPPRACTAKLQYLFVVSVQCVCFHAMSSLKERNSFV